MSNGYSGDSFLKFKIMVVTGNLNLGTINVLMVLKAMGMDDNTLRTKIYKLRLEGTANGTWWLSRLRIQLLVLP